MAFAMALAPPRIADRPPWTPNSAEVATDAASIEAEDVDRLRDAGLSDADIADVVFAASARCFSLRSWTAWGCNEKRIHH